MLCTHNTMTINGLVRPPDPILEVDHQWPRVKVQATRDEKREAIIFNFAEGI